jgi:uncharacterized peroxidase-related enzyme
MSWIETISYAQATGRLRTLYERLGAPQGQIDNILAAHSLRPHTLEGHMALYKAVLHHSGNRLPSWLLESIGVYVSLLNGCAYCVEHHHAGLRRVLGDPARADLIRRALEADDRNGIFDERGEAILCYVRALTLSPADLDKSYLAAMRVAGMADGEILEINQVASYFAYANRTVLGLGITTGGESLGLAPDDGGDARDWRHS